MREIKFRVFFENKFWYFTLDQIMERAITYKGDWDLKALRAEKQQYTGLKDKNGKEIYEGDIISCCGINLAVEWDDEDAQWNTIGRRGQTAKEFCEKREVVGNIYENPELVEGLI